jgi:hypothetical protein
MKVPAEIGHQLCGILGACWSDGYKNLVHLAEALERVAANCRRLAAEQSAANVGDRLIG